MSRKVADSSGCLEVRNGCKTQGQSRIGEGEPSRKVLESYKHENEERQQTTKGCPNTEETNKTSQTEKRTVRTLDEAGVALKSEFTGGVDSLAKRGVHVHGSHTDETPRDHLGFSGISHDGKLCTSQVPTSKSVCSDVSVRHVVHEHEGVRAPGVFEGEARRGVSFEVHKDSVATSFGRAGRRGEDVCQSREESHTFTSNGGGIEPSFQEEVRSPASCATRAGVDNLGQRDDRPVEDQGLSEGIRVGTSDSGGLCGLWGACRADVRGGDSPSPTVCPVGGADHEGGPVFTEAQEIGEVGRGPGAPACGGKQGRHGEQVQGLHEVGDQEWGLEQQLRPGELGGTVSGVSEATNRGSEGHQGHSGSSWQEDRRGREFFDRMGEDVGHSLAVNHLGSSSYEPGEAMGPAGCVKSLDRSTARKLDVMAARMGPDNFQEVVASRRPLLFEIACGPDSVLTTNMRKLTGKENSAERLSFWNGYDLTKSQGVRSVMAKIDKDQPMHVWLSLECGPFSRMQNVNQRNDRQREELAQKRANCIRQYVGGLLIYSHCVQQGIPVTWEWSETCDAWRLPMVQRVFQKYKPQFCVVKGCRVNLRDPKSGAYLGKGWKLATTHELLAKRMHLPCVCQEKHVLCQGPLTRMSAYYTDVFAKRVCKAIVDGLDFQDLTSELLGQKSFPREFQGHCQGCSRELVCHPKSDLKCNYCEKNREKQDPLSLVGEEIDVREPLSEEERQRCLRKLMMLHRNTGHGPREHLVRALEARGTDPRIVDLARNLECSACQEAKRHVPRPHATLDPLPPKWNRV